ncbi:hypothetical protein ALO52_200118 [Pseudomonas syringae pv. primulae]|uniref:Chitinase n=1 Tax=Pseudomonas syringae pv. primulae TaxID=251707 RepID=A0A0P9YUA6_9PSED|nr:hypothetical protein ALO52_200118 [Pseudomonas syringae pv. primulae]
MADYLVALVVLKRIGCAITESLDSPALLQNPGRAQQIVVFRHPTAITPVATLKRLTCLTGKRETPP